MNCSHSDVPKLLILSAEKSISDRLLADRCCGTIDKRLMSFKLARRFKESDSGRGDSMSQRMVKCVKLGRELPGLEEPPWSGELGQRIYDHVSQEAWNHWLDYLRMLINEYRLAPATKEAQEFIAQQMEKFFFGEGSAPPPGYVSPQP
jgi:Fe-S cluster biosynthesis and repair protein YggX